jgi:hypothetical protein
MEGEEVAVFGSLLQLKELLKTRHQCSPQSPHQHLNVRKLVRQPINQIVHRLEIAILGSDELPVAFIV